MIRCAIVVLLAAGCAVGCGGAPRSAIGPYVKNIARNGDWLAVIKCQIILENNQLSEESCVIEQLPLGPIPMAPMPAAPAVIPESPATPPPAAPAPGAKRPAAARPR
ncbi:MAG: hypothetical protein AB7P03_20170 [Kofleriaceae bacterium]